MTLGVHWWKWFIVSSVHANSCAGSIHGICGLRIGIRMGVGQEGPLSALSSVSYPLQKHKDDGIDGPSSHVLRILWMDEILNHFETMKNHLLVGICVGESNQKLGFLSVAGLRNHPQYHTLGLSR